MKAKTDTRLFDAYFQFDDLVQWFEDRNSQKLTIIFIHIINLTHIIIT